MRPYMWRSHLTSLIFITKREREKKKEKRKEKEKIKEKRTKEK